MEAVKSISALIKEFFATEDQESKHALYAASGFERLVECPGHVSLSKDLPNPPSSPAAKEGTRAHKVLELLSTKGNTEKNRNILRDAFGSPMVKHAEWALENMEDGIKSETKVDLKFLDPEAGGTCDGVLNRYPNELIIYDYKYGVKPVEAEDNHQMIGYALGLAYPFAFLFKRIRLKILQPRAYHKKGLAREWSLSGMELFGRLPTYEKAIAQSKLQKPPFKIGKWCYFCKAKNICPTYRADWAQGEFDVETDFEEIKERKVSHGRKKEKVSSDGRDGHQKKKGGR